MVTRYLAVLACLPALNTRLSRGDLRKTNVRDKSQMNLFSLLSTFLLLSQCCNLHAGILGVLSGVVWSILEQSIAYTPCRSNV